ERYVFQVNGSILIVDDEDDTAVLLRDSLRKRGFDVDSVNSAQQALEHLRTEPVDVVVTDVQMAGITGIELCQELRQRYPDLLPIVLTGQGGLETAIAAIRAGAYDFITHQAVEGRPLRVARRSSTGAPVAPARGQAPALGRRSRCTD